MGSPLANQLAKLLQLAGISITAAQLEANAAQFATIPTALLIPGLIWALMQVYTGLPTSTTGYIYMGLYGTAGPQFTPSSAGAIAIDMATLRQWQWANNFWS